MGLLTEIGVVAPSIGITNALFTPCLPAARRRRQHPRARRWRRPQLPSVARSSGAPQASVVLRQPGPAAQERGGVRLQGFPVRGPRDDRVGKAWGLAAQHRLPAMYTWRMYVDAGDLMSYGVSLLEQYRRTATYVDKILKGAKPAGLPVEQPMKFELIINLNTAKALGITIPPALLLLADEVIQ